MKNSELSINSKLPRLFYVLLLSPLTHHTFPILALCLFLTKKQDSAVIPIEFPLVRISLPHEHVLFCIVILSSISYLNHVSFTDKINLSLVFLSTFVINISNRTGQREGFVAYIPLCS